MFIVDVSTTGELGAKSSENIFGPGNLLSLEIWGGDLKINKLIPEGTLVDSGDYVASIDQTEVMSKLKDIETELEKLRIAVHKDNARHFAHTKSSTQRSDKS